MNLERKLWCGALAAAAMTIGSAAHAAFIDDWQVAFGGPNYIGTLLGNQEGGGPLVFTDTSAAGVVGTFGATRTSTLTYSAAIEQGQNSLLSVNTFMSQLNLTQSVGQDIPISVDLNYVFAGGVDLSDWSSFDFSVSVDQIEMDPMVLHWEVIQGATTSNASLDIVGGGDFNLAFASFGGIDFANGLIDGVNISFTTPAGFVGLDVGLSAISPASVIPVPPAAGLILIGMIGMGLHAQLRKQARRK